jgi:predicted phage-related endonuclease
MPVSDARTSLATLSDSVKTGKTTNRRHLIGGSDARIIMGDDESALIRLWREKRGEVDLDDLSGNLIVQLGLATEELNRRWYQAKICGSLRRDLQCSR